jgi:hypothetical protein
MPNKPLDRLMFIQGAQCFFCKQPLPKTEASVEHLLASANGGGNSDDNCVACCKSVNALLGSMSVKEKFQVVLNQKGQFKCPNGAGAAKAVAQPKALPTVPNTGASNDERFKLVVTNLKQRGDSRPRTLKTLTTTIVSLLPKVPEQEITALVQKLQSTGKVSVSEEKVSYTL